MRLGLDFIRVAAVKRILLEFQEVLLATPRAQENVQYPKRNSVVAVNPTYSLPYHV